MAKKPVKDTKKKDESKAGETKEASIAEKELAKAVELVTPLAKAGKSDDEMAIALMTDGGFAFKKAGRLLNKALINLNIRMSSADRYDKVRAILVETEFAPTEWSEVQETAEYLAEEIDATTEVEALASIRKYARDQEFELPKKVKGIRAGYGYRQSVFDWMAENPLATNDELKVKMEADEKPISMIRLLGRYFDAFRKYAAAHAEATQ